MSRVFAVALGGALGALARYWLGTALGERFSTRLPFGTLFINVTGSFILGFFLTFATERMQVPLHWRLAVAVGFIGAYTTFSTFEYETFKLLETGSGIAGFMNVILSLLLGFLGVWGGAVTARAVRVETFVEKRAPMERKHRDLENLNIPFESLDQSKEVGADGS